MVRIVTVKLNIKSGGIQDIPARDLYLELPRVCLIIRDARAAVFPPMH